MKKQYKPNGRHFKVHGAWMTECGLNVLDGQVFPVLRHVAYTKASYVTLQLPGREWVVDEIHGEFVETIRGYDHGLNIDTVAGDQL